MSRLVCSASLNRFYLVAQCNLANTYYMRNDPAGLKYAEEVCRLGTEWGYDYLAFGGAVISAIYAAKNIQQASADLKAATEKMLHD